ncbi:hypothetical protein NQ317_002120 [Molorchus minor]|uniref:Major facilitator superfamily (MFS) profile domain-containing protein n=1 Tax=Molorchus minor TaxID=1323400 RepID=A0ABQ9JUG3_9CUCU|nr:hypothetical protein NQ317_002120 [Molorchus minor]
MSSYEMDVIFTTLTNYHSDSVPGNLVLFACGTALTWSSSELPKLADPRTAPFDRPITSEEGSWISSLRKPTLLYLGAPLAVCHLFLAFGTTVQTFFAARFLIGVALGGAFVVMPIYITEISDKSNRGALASSTSCFVCFGVLFTCALGPYVSVMVFNLILGVFPVVFLAFFHRFAVETPHFHAMKNDVERARDVLEKIRVGGDTIDKELAEIQTCVGEMNDSRFASVVSSKSTLKAMYISVGLLVFQQFSGINAVLFYSQQIFQQTGSDLSPEICTIIVVGVQFFSSFVTPFIVDKFGRKIILFCSAAGMAVSEIPLGIYCYCRQSGLDLDRLSFLPVLSLTSFIVCFNVGFGPLPWALLSELFPPTIKSVASASVASVIWMLAFFVTKYFEVMVVAVGVGQMFLFFAFCCAVAALFVVVCVVETRGKSLKEIQDILRC